MKTPNGNAVFRITTVKPYYEPNEVDSIDPNINDLAVTHELSEKTTQTAHESNTNNTRQNPTRTHQLPQRYRNSYTEVYLFYVDNILQPDCFLSDKETYHLNLSNQLRKEGRITASGPPFEDSRYKELESLQKRGILQTVPRHLATGRIFGLRFVDEIKDVMENPYEKSRLVVKAFNDIEKKNILTQSPTIQRVSQRIIICIGASLICNLSNTHPKKTFDLFLRDVTQAYTQSKTSLNRNVFARPPKEMIVKKGHILKINGPLYGIPESGRHWYKTYVEHHTEKLKLQKSTYDPCLLFTKTDDDAFGLLGMQTDDTLFVADSKFAQREAEEINQANIMTKARISLQNKNQLSFNGAVIKLEKSHISMLPKGQGDKLQIVNEKNGNFYEKYREKRARGAYIASICQPEASFDLSTAAQIQHPTVDETKYLNKRLAWQILNKERGMNYIGLDLKNVKLYIFVDGSFAGNKDFSSQIGFVAVLGNETFNNNKCFSLRGNIIHWSSVKCKRITRSALASELYGMVSGIDIGIAIKTSLDKIFDRLGFNYPPLVACTYSYSLYDCLVKLGTTSEKRLMIDVMALRESYETREITEVRWIDGKDNLADAMTKSNPNSALRKLVDDNEISIRIDGWVTRPE